MTLKNVLAAAALVAATSAAAAAQTDFGSPIGAGGGLGGAVAPLGLPGGNNNGAAGNSGVSPAGLANARSAFVNATGGGVTVQNPAGGTVTVPQAAAQALGGVLGGSPTPAQSQALTAALGGGAPATALTNALAAMGSNPSIATVTNAVNAFNAAIDALPAGQAPSPAVLAARQAIARAMGR